MDNVLIHCLFRLHCCGGIELPHGPNRRLYISLVRAYIEAFGYEAAEWMRR